MTDLDIEVEFGLFSEKKETLPDNEICDVVNSPTPIVDRAFHPVEAITTEPSNYERKKVRLDHEMLFDITFRREYVSKNDRLKRVDSYFAHYNGTILINDRIKSRSLVRVESITLADVVSQPIKEALAVVLARENYGTDSERLEKIRNIVLEADRERRQNILEALEGEMRGRALRSLEQIVKTH